MEYNIESLCLSDEKQVDVTGSVLADYHPLTILTAGGPTEFHIPDIVDEYIDLSAIHLLLVWMKITKNDGKHLDAADKMAFINPLVVFSRCFRNYLWQTSRRKSTLLSARY